MSDDRKKGWRVSSTKRKSSPGEQMAEACAHIAAAYIDLVQQLVPPDADVPGIRANVETAKHIVKVLQR